MTTLTLGATAFKSRPGIPNNRREKNVTRENAQKNIVVLVDYENVAREAAMEGMVVDFEKLAELCRSYGRIIISVLFVPKHQLNNPWFDDAWLQGFYITPVPTQIPDREKQYRTADTMMIDFGTRMLALTDVDYIVIVSNDADFITLANQTRDAGKQIVLVAGDNVSRALVRAVDFHIQVPMKVY
jgi:hypothetical protein